MVSELWELNVNSLAATQLFATLEGSRADPPFDCRTTTYALKLHTLELASPHTTFNLPLLLALYGLKLLVCEFSVFRGDFGAIQLNSLAAASIIEAF